MGPIWGRQDPGGPHVGPINFAIWVTMHNSEQMRWGEAYVPYEAIRQWVIIGLAMTRSKSVNPSTSMYKLIRKTCFAGTDPFCTLADDVGEFLDDLIDTLDGGQS